LILFLQWLPRSIQSVDLAFLYLNPIVQFRTFGTLSTLIATISAFWVFSGVKVFDGTFLEGGDIVFVYPTRFLSLHASITRCFTIG
jgi:hypothetical protein